jgi:ELWxxDGT repeat protein
MNTASVRRTLTAASVLAFAGSAVATPCVGPTGDALAVRAFDLTSQPSQSSLLLNQTMVAWNGRVYFSAFQPPNPTLPAGGWTLWASDGTPSGTARLTDFAFLPGSTSAGQRLIAGTPDVLWVATVSSQGSARLWRTDGTPGGTVLIDTPGLSSSQPFPVVGSRVLFSDGLALQAAEVGSTTPTVLLPIPAGAGLAAFTPFPTPAGPKVLFARNALGTSSTTAEIFITDGTPAGTTLLGSFTYPFQTSIAYTTSFVVADGRAYFTAGTGAEGVEVFTTDGTPAGTGLHTDILPGPNSWSSTRVLGVAGGKLYATIRFSDLLVGTSTPGSLATFATLGIPTNLTFPFLDFGGKAIFAARYPFSDPVLDLGTELYVTDGTAGGTGVLQDIAPGQGTSSIISSFSTPVVVGTGPSARLLFAAAPGTSQNRLYRTDGTGAGTEQVSPTLVVDASQLRSVGAFAFVSGTDAAMGSELYVVGPTGTPELLKDIFPGPTGSSPSLPVEVPSVGPGQRWVFSAMDPVNGRELWVTDGTTAGTSLIADIAGGSVSTSPGAFVRLDRSALFGPASASSTSPVGVFRWDGSRAPATLVATDDANTPPSAIRSVRAGLGVAGGAYFAGLSAGVNADAMYFTDGTAAGTRRLTSTGESTPPQVRYAPSNQETGAALSGTALGSSFVFSGSAPSIGTELCITDGTPASTRLLRDIAPGTAISSPRSFAAIGGKVYFYATTPSSGGEPWVTDGTEGGTVQLGDLFPGVSSSELQPGNFPRRKAFVGYGSRVYFAGQTTSASPPAIFSTDGTPAGTRPEPLGPVTLSGSARAIAIAGGSLVFFGFTAALGDELYALDAVGGTPRLVAELFPGAARVSGELDELGGGFVLFRGPGASGSSTRPWFSDGTAANTRPFTQTLAGQPISSVIPGPTYRSRTFFVATTNASPPVSAVYAFTTDPGAACVVAAYTGSSPTPPWGLALVGSRLFLAPGDPVIGVEPAVIELCPGDFTNDGSLAPTDIFALLSSYFAASPAADIDGSGTLAPADVFAFLTRYFAGCD